MHLCDAIRMEELCVQELEYSRHSIKLKDNHFYVYLYFPKRWIFCKLNLTFEVMSFVLFF